MTDARPVPDGHAAAARWIAPLVGGARRPCRVVAVHPAAAVVEVAPATAHGPGAVLTLVTGDAGVATAHAVVTSLPLPPVGASGHVGGNELVLAGATLRLQRTWDSAVPRTAVDRDAVELVRTLLAGRPTGLAAAPVDRLLASVPTGSGTAAAATALVGLGAGSTPAGDDVLAGCALAAHAVGAGGLLAALRAVGPDLDRRTTPLSADLLRAALHGHTALPVLRLLAALRPDRATDARILATTAVLGLGHTSGADLLTGLVGTLTALDRAGSGGPPADRGGPAPGALSPIALVAR